MKTKILKVTFLKEEVNPCGKKSTKEVVFYHTCDKKKSLYENASDAYAIALTEKGLEFRKKVTFEVVVK